jgi:hypothetical protein
MTREEFFLKAVIELSANMPPMSGALKQQLDKAIEMAQYLTQAVYGENKASDSYTALI